MAGISPINHEEDKHVEGIDAAGNDARAPTVIEDLDPSPGWKTTTYQLSCVLLLLLSYFLSQYDKFVVSYFQAEIVSELSITAAGYGALTGYGTSVLSSFAILPIAIFTDHSSARVWVLAGTILWWSLMMVFQSLSHHFWQMVCARLGMFLGQAASEAIAVSLISDIVPLRFVPMAESFLYVGVYIGEAISARISAVFKETGQSWRLAFRAIGITGIVIAVVTRIWMREPRNKRQIMIARSIDKGPWHTFLLAEVSAAFRYVMGLRSFWLITLAASLRQLGGVTFGYYMPTLLQLQYPDDLSYLITTYGTIVGTVGSVTVMTGGFVTTMLHERHPTIALHLTAWGGVLSWPFVVILTFSRQLGGSPDRGLAILFGSLAAAYITAELWLGAIAATVVRLLPIRYKTLGFAVYALTNLIVYSSGPEIVAIAQYRSGVEPNTDPDRYVRVTRIVLCVIIPFGYCAAAVCFLFASRTAYFLADLNTVQAAYGTETQVVLHGRRKMGFGIALGAIGAMVVALTIASYVLEV